MTVYADILFILNFTVDYFLLRGTDILLKRKAKLYRLLLSSLLGGIFSFYIFLPQSPVFTEILIKIIMCGIMTVVAFEPVSVSTFLRTALTFTLLTFSYGGINIVIWQTMSPPDMVINNSVVYFGISPLVLIASSVVFYITVSLAKRFFGKRVNDAKRCSLKITAGQNKKTFVGILDTGNTLSDVFSNSAVIIVNKKSLESLFAGVGTKERFRAIPCKTVSGEGILSGYRADSGCVTVNGKDIPLRFPIVVRSKTVIPDNEAILNPQILER